MNNASQLILTLFMTMMILGIIAFPVIIIMVIVKGVHRTAQLLFHTPFWK